VVGFVTDAAIDGTGATGNLGVSRGKISSEDLL